jgi:hypothetical protein
VLMFVRGDEDGVEKTVRALVDGDVELKRLRIVGGAVRG